jgi:hypothetical protein
MFDDGGAVEEAVQDGGGDHAVAAEQLLASVRPIADPPAARTGSVGRVPVPDPGKRTCVPLSQRNDDGRLRC